MLLMPDRHSRGSRCPPPGEDTGDTVEGEGEPADVSRGTCRYHIRKNARCFSCFSRLIGEKAGKAPRRKAATETIKQITNRKARKAKASKSKGSI